MRAHTTYFDRFRAPESGERVLACKDARAWAEASHEIVQDFVFFLRPWHRRAHQLGARLNKAGEHVQLASQSTTTPHASYLDRFQAAFPELFDVVFDARVLHTVHAEAFPQGIVLKARPRGAVSTRPARTHYRSLLPKSLPTAPKHAQTTPHTRAHEHEHTHTHSTHAWSNGHSWPRRTRGGVGRRHVGSFIVRGFAGRDEIIVCAVICRVRGAESRKVGRMTITAPTAW